LIGHPNDPPLSAIEWLGKIVCPGITPVQTGQNRRTSAPKIRRFLKIEGAMIQ